MNNKILKGLVIAASILCLVGFVSCEDYTGGEAPTQEALAFDGTIEDFIENANYEGMAFDSLKYIVNTIPGLRDSLSNTDARYTLFAVSDASFGKAMTALNEYRKSNGIGNGLSLKDFMIEPFTVVDSIITNIGTINGKPLNDTTIVKRNYDYRSNLDSLVCRYAFKQEITFENAIGGSYMSIFSHEMNIASGYRNASGAVGLGMPYMQLIETNNSKYEAVWVKADVQTINLHCKNGVIHILSPEHEFAFNEIIKIFGNYGNEQKKN